MAGSAASALSLLVAIVAAAAVRRRVRRLLVSGDSMSPTLRHGDRLLAVACRAARPGDVVAFRHPRRPGMIAVKRVVRAIPAAAPSGPWRRAAVAAYEVAGDNTARSTDSRDFGPVPAAAVLGRVVWRYFPASRRGRVPGGAEAGPGAPGGAGASGSAGLSP